jgi:N-acyl-D-aspartate/D-glutamate deacylase
MRCDAMRCDAVRCDAVRAAQPALNVAALIGHTTLRYATMNDLGRAATAPERERMAALLHACLGDGAPAVLARTGRMLTRGVNASRGEARRKAGR